MVSAARSIKQTYMKTEDWGKNCHRLDVAGNVTNRDEEKRIRQGKAKHLRAFHIDQLSVKVARTPDGKLWKLDGHTRWLAWSTGYAVMPEEVAVQTFEMASYSELRQHYEVIDSKKAAKSSSDEICSALGASRANLSTPWLADGKFSDTLNLIALRNRERTRFDTVELFSPALKLLDGISPKEIFFRKPMLAAALLTLKTDGADALEFWRLFNEGVQDLNEHGYSLPAAARFLLESGGKAKNNGCVGWAGFGNDEVWTRGFIGIYDAWKRDPGLRVKEEEIHLKMSPGIAFRTYVEELWI